MKCLKASYIGVYKDIYVLYKYLCNHMKIELLLSLNDRINLYFNELKSLVVFRVKGFLYCMHSRILVLDIYFEVAALPS
jgi:hypothetical protein